MKKRAWSSILLGSALLGMCILAGCGSDKGGAVFEPAPKSSKEAKDQTDHAAVPPISSDPVKLTIYFGTGKPNEQEFETIYISPLKMKYPNITLQMVDGKLEDRVAAGEMPDLIYTHVGNLFAMKDLELLVDMNPLIKKIQGGTARFDPIIVQGIEQASPGQLTALPYMLNLKALYYNKDLFDKFGVPYPKDGMNWKDAITLGKRLTRSEGGQLDRQSIRGGLF